MFSQPKSSQQITLPPPNSIPKSSRSGSTRYVLPVTMSENAQVYQTTTATIEHQSSANTLTYRIRGTTENVVICRMDIDAGNWTFVHLKCMQQRSVLGRPCSACCVLRPTENNGLQRLTTKPTGYNSACLNSTQKSIKIHEKLTSDLRFACSCMESRIIPDIKVFKNVHKCSQNLKPATHLWTMQGATSNETGGGGLRASVVKLCETKTFAEWARVRSECAVSEN